MIKFSKLDHKNMKLSCTQENLNKGLYVVSNIVSNSATLPILKNILFKAEEGSLKLIATDLEIAAKALVRGKVEQTGEFTIDGKLLTNFVNLLPPDRVDLIVEKNILNLKSSEHTTKINGLPAEDFPVIPKIDKKESFKLKARDFKQALIQVVFSVSLNDARPEISGVYFAVENNQLVLAGTDSFRLAEKKVKIQMVSGITPDAQAQVGKLKNFKPIIVPLRTIKEVLRIIFEEDEQIEIFTSDNQILFSLPDRELISRLIEGDYPDYKQIIPSAFKTKAEIDKQDFLSAIRIAGLFTQKDVNTVVLDIQPSTGKILIESASSSIGEEKTLISAKIEGDLQKIVFDYRYLLDGLNNLPSEEVIFEFVSPSAPALMRPKLTDQTPDYLYIIMPIRQ